MNALMQDPMTFYSIAFVIFMGLAYRYGRKPFLTWIDAEILKIRDELDQARKLRAEAEATLAEYKAKQTAALAEAEAIVKHAKDEAVRMKSDAESDLKNALARHEQQAMERIRIAETEAMAEVRAAAIDLAMSMARKTLASELDATTATKLTDQAIADMPKAESAKAKAA
jgi:F-type H+-transporting ATPase subunit b